MESSALVEEDSFRAEESGRYQIGLLNGFSVSSFWLWGEGFAFNARQHILPIGVSQSVQFDHSVTEERTESLFATINDDLQIWFTTNFTDYEWELANNINNNNTEVRLLTHRSRFTWNLKYLCTYKLLHEPIYDLLLNHRGWIECCYWYGDCNGNVWK